MTELLKKIFENCYTVPAENEHDERLYTLKAELANSLTQEKNIVIDQLMDVHIDLVSEAAKDGFVQGFFGGIMLACELYLHKKLVLEEKET
jgi:hypothetical protein